jgi:hypothetical protein
MEHAAEPGGTTQKLWRHFSRAHLWIFLVLYCLFAAFTGYILSRQSQSDRRDNWNAAATLGAVAGPLTGAVARNLQSCCLKFSLALLPYCGGIVIGGLAFQLVPLPFQRAARSVRLTIWTLALLGWFGGGVLSLGHALS